MLKQACLFAMILLASANSLDAQWRKIADFIGTDHDFFTGSEPITYVYFMDLPGAPRIGFAGSESELHKTTDGGKSWRSVWDSGNCYDQYYPTDLCFKDSLIGWMSVYNQYQSTADPCYRTTDGGEHWVKLNVPGGRKSGGNSVHYCAQTNRLLLSSDTAIWISTDFGDTWPISLSYLANVFSFWSPLKGIIAASPYPYDISIYLLTSDGGITWDTIHPVLPDSVNYSGEPLAIPGSSTCFVATQGHSSAVLRSDDFGRTWRQIAHLTPVDSGTFCTGIIRGDLSRLYTQTTSGMYVSVDEGIVWKSDGGPPYNSVFTNDRFYSGHGVTIAGYTYSDGSIASRGLWEEDWPWAGVERNHSLDSNYTLSGNPFDNSTTLHFTLSEACYEKVDVLDVLGREVWSEGVGKLLDPGEHQVPIDLSSAPSGTYFLRISLGTGEVRTIKMVKE